MDSFKLLKLLEWYIGGYFCLVIIVVDFQQVLLLGILILNKCILWYWVNFCLLGVIRVVVLQVLFVFFVIGKGKFFVRIVIWNCWVMVCKNFFVVVAIVVVCFSFLVLLFKKVKFFGKFINFVFWCIVKLINFFVFCKFLVRLGWLVICRVVVKYGFMKIFCQKEVVGLVVYFILIGCRDGICFKKEVEGFIF